MIVKKYIIVNQAGSFLMMQPVKNKRDEESARWIFQDSQEDACVFFSLKYASFIAEFQNALVKELEA